jgi:hypothetical protein
MSFGNSLDSRRRPASPPLQNLWMQKGCARSLEFRERTVTCWPTRAKSNRCASVGLEQSEERGSGIALAFGLS